MRVSTSIDIDAPVEAVWEIIGPGFADVAEWASAVRASRPTSPTGPNGAPCAGRRCTVAATGFDQITEELTEYDPLRRRLTYRAAHGMPRIVTEARNTWQVLPRQGGGTRFTMDADVELHGTARLAAPVLRGYLLRMARRTADDLRIRAETGSVGPAGAARIRADATGRLSRWVAANAVFSGTCGVLLALAADHWSRQLGGPGAPAIALLGVGLVGYAAMLARAAHQGVTRSTGRIIAGLDGAWVVGTVAVLALAGDRFSTQGLVAAVDTGLAVALFGWFQWRAATAPGGRAAPLDPVKSGRSGPGYPAG
jgi:hypothetical protein